MSRRSQLQLAVGQTVVDHELLEVLGRGASATVFRARAPSGEQVALKIRQSGEPGMDRRFLREFESIRRLRLESVVRVLDAGLNREWIWYSMEVVEGKPLRAYIAQTESIAERTLRACESGARLCEALVALHRAGFVHRDLKPSNVLVTPTGQVRILDFGVVQWWAVSESLTGSGGLVGTPSFMSPQAIGGVAVTGAADIFATALMLYEGMVGRRQRPAQPTGWLARQVLERTPPMACVDPRVPMNLSAALTRCLHFDPQQRPSARELAELLRGCLDGSAPSDWPEPYRFVGRRVELQALDSSTQGKGPRLTVLLGDAGSGKRRLQEQACRRALLQSTRTLSGSCRLDAPGHPVGEWMADLLGAPDKRSWREKVVGRDGGALLQLWPSLPLHALNQSPSGEATQRDVVQATLRCLMRAAAQSPLVLVLHQAEYIDGLSSQVLRAILRSGYDRITVIALVDPRRLLPRSERLLERAEEQPHSHILRLGPMPAVQAQALAQSLVPPGADSPVVGRSTPLQAAQVGLALLAQLRSEPFYELPPQAAKLAIVQRPLPQDVLQAWLGSAGPLLSRGFLVQTLQRELRVAGGSFQTAASAQLQDAQAAHAELALAWEREGARRSRWIRIAHHRLHAQAPDAWEACVRAADAAQRTGRYTHARHMLLVLDHLKQDRRTETYRRFRFDLAFARARVAERTDAERPRQDLVDAARSRAISAEQLHWATLLQAELDLREGHYSQALTLAHDTARASAAQFPAVAAALWLCCAQGWMQQADPARARACAQSAQRLARDNVLPLLECSAQAAEVEASLSLGSLSGLEHRSLQGWQQARSLEHQGAQAWHGRNLGVALMRAGRRADAEHALAQARERCVRNSDLAGAATASLQLATLGVGRGEPAVAKRWLAEGLATAKKLKLRRLEPLAATVQLDLATQIGDPELARQAREMVGGSTQAWPWKLAELRWLRTQGDAKGAERVALSIQPQGYHGALARLELARLRIEEQQLKRARAPLAQGLGIARGQQLQELVAYGELMEGLLFQRDVIDWEQRLQRARSSTWVELFLGALEFEARVLLARGAQQEAEVRLRTLHSRAVDMGSRPYARAALELLMG